MGNLDFSANADQLQELLSYIASQINVPTIGIGGGDAPIGKIDFFDATVAPQDYLACDGTVYNIADYPQLADWYEAQHGSKNFYGGDGTTTFAVPDLRGEFLRGTGTNSHANQGSGANVGEHQDGTIHMNIYDAGALQMEYSTSQSKRTNADYSGSANKVIWANLAGNESLSTDGGGFTSRPTNTSFLICVKAVVAGDVYSTEERVGGTWIDGKKWYYKTVTVNCGANGTWYSENHNISNIKEVIGYEFIVKNSNDIYFSSGCASQSISALSVLVSATQVVMYNNYPELVNKPIKITIKYTKTTD